MSQNRNANADSHLSNQAPSQNSTQYTECLLQCMTERLEISRAIQALGRTQVDAVDSADMNATLRILARKQTLLEQLETVCQRLQPYHHDDPEARVWESPEQRTYCQQLADEGSRLLQESSNVDQCLLADMTDRRDVLAAQLQDGTDSILAHTAYTAGNDLDVSSLDISDA